MAGSRFVPAVGPSYALADRKSAVQRSVNLFLREIEAPGEDKPAILASVPGLVEHLDIGATIRGSYATDTRWFVVAGSTLYELTSGAAVSRGTLSTSSGYVCMKHGRDQLALVDGSNGYVLNLSTNVFSTITDVDWRGSNWVEELDGYFIFFDPGTDQFYLSSIDDATTLDALDFSSADAAPDDITTHRVMKRELYLMGSRSIEVWINSGDSDFPFTRYNSTPIDIGVCGQRACIRAADTLVFVGQTERGRGYVYIMQGHQPVRISTRAVEEALASSTDLTQVSMWSYHVEGSEFVAVNAPGMTTTWVWDAATKQWHERAKLVDGEWAAWPTDEVTFFDGEHYATYGTKTYRLDDETYTIAGDPLRRERTWPHLVSPSMERVAYRGLELACTTGHGGNVTLEISNDGGFTWGSPLIRSLGVTGQWMQPVRWHMLGSARDRVFRIRCSDDVPFNVHAATVNAGG